MFGLVIRWLLLHTDTSTLYTPSLHSAAARAGHTASVAALLAGGARPDAASTNGLGLEREGWTALMWAAHAGQVDSVAALTAGGACADASDGQETPLAVAVRRGQEDCVAALLAAGADPNHPCDPVRLAALAGQAGCLAALLAAGGGADSVCRQRGLSALYLSASHGYADCTAALLVAGADPNKAHLGLTALHAASEQGHASCVAALITGGANVNCAESHGLVSDLCCFVAFTQSFLIWYGSIEQWRCSMQPGAVHALAARCFPLLPEYLLPLHSPRLAPLQTPLHLAAAGGHQACVAALLSAGARQTYVKSGRNPFDEAMRRGHHGVAAMLVEAEPLPPPPPRSASEVRARAAGLLSSAAALLHNQSGAWGGEGGFCCCGINASGMWAVNGAWSCNGAMPAHAC